MNYDVVYDLSISDGAIGFGAMLRRIRRERGETALTIGLRANVTGVYVAMIERGEKVPSYGRLLALLDAYGVSWESDGESSGRVDFLDKTHLVCVDVSATGRKGEVIRLQRRIAELEAEIAVLRTMAGVSRVEVLA